MLIYDPWILCLYPSLSFSYRSYQAVLNICILHLSIVARLFAANVLVPQVLTTDGTRPESFRNTRFNHYYYSRLLVNAYG